MALIQRWDGSERPAVKPVVLVLGYTILRVVPWLKLRGTMQPFAHRSIAAETSLYLLVDVGVGNWLALARRVIEGVEALCHFRSRRAGVRVRFVPKASPWFQNSRVKPRWSNDDSR